MGGELQRGEKWFHVRRINDLKGKTKILDWMTSQKSIVNDIEVYEASLTPAEEVVAEETFLEYTKLELQGLCDEGAIEYTDANTKSELIELLQGAV